MVHILTFKTPGRMRARPMTLWPLSGRSTPWRSSVKPDSVRDVVSTRLGNPSRNTGTNYPPPDAVQEVRIPTHNFAAEYGHNPGAQVDVVSKSGSIEFHGSSLVATGRMKGRKADEDTSWRGEVSGNRRGTEVSSLLLPEGTGPPSPGVRSAIQSEKIWL